jgi:hypothetical protein
MALVEPKTKVLEDGDQGLLDGERELGEAEIVGEDEEIVDLNAPAEDGVGTEPAAKPAAKPEQKPVAKPAAKPEEDELPEELKGKTPAQLAKMYREAQAVIGRQGSELGTYRKKVDQYIQASLAGLAAKGTPKKEEPAAPAAPDESEFFAKPLDAVSKAIENHPLIKEIRATLGKSAAESAASRAAASQERFNAAHPDSQEILGDPDFRRWVGASRVRTALMQRAHQNFDYEAGDEVFSTWKALKGNRAGKAEEPATGAPSEADVKAAASTMARAKAVKAAQEAAVKAAVTPTGGASAGKPAGTKKIYRRADILKMMEEQPDRYEAMSDEITAAYRENRVR